MARTKSAPKSKAAESYKHPEATSPMRPEVGTQAQFKKKKPPQTYRYDSSLSPVLEYDGQNPAREQGEALLAEARSQNSEARKLLAALKDIKPANLPKAEAETLKRIIAQIETALKTGTGSLDRLKAMSSPFLNWAGKAERLSFDVPTLPLFVHERLSTKAIIETLKGHMTDKQEDFVANLFADPRHSVADQLLRAYEYKDNWVNRLILGDSLVAMNSLLHYESLGGQVQMIYMDPPYGVKFGSNFQPFVRQKEFGDVDHNDDESFTREPEMVQAYRDTWELGLHSYLTYLRDRLLLCRDLLTPSGSIFVQISDENCHHVRELMDEVYGAENFVSQINFQTTSGFETKTIATLGDFLLWYAKDHERVRVNKLFQKKEIILGEGNARWVLMPNGTYRGVTAAERRGDMPVPKEGRLYKPDNILSQGSAKEPQPFEHLGKTYNPKANSHWKANWPDGMRRLAEAGRIHVAKNSIQYRRYPEDFPYEEVGNIWTDTQTGSFTDDKIYVVQTNLKVAERCLLLTSSPGDLVLDPTCGSGTTAYVAEQWGRRWITMDTSRVPLALARQRLLTATFPYYELKDETRGPAGGFEYKRKQNNKGEEVGGIVPHVTLESIANNEPPKEETLWDRPEVVSSLVRVSGPLAVEATIPTPMDWEGDGKEDSGVVVHEDYGSFVDRMLEVLRKSPVLRLEGNRTVTLKNIHPPAKSLSLNAEAMVESPDLTDLKHDAEGKQSLIKNQRPVAFVFGPENGAVSEKLVYEAAREAHAKNYAQLYVIGFAIQPNARELVEKCAEAVGVPATYVQATPDLMMGDLLKNMRSSQIFSVCGLPEIDLRKTKADGGKKGTAYEVELLGMDLFDPVTMEAEHRGGNDVPCWLLDSDYNGLCFRATQVFFPRTSAWENLKKALKGGYDETVWDHLAGTVSAPFEKGEHDQIAVKVIDDRGNELLVVKSLKEAKK